MQLVSTWLRTLYRSFDKAARTAFLSAFLAGVFCHAHAMILNLTAYDAVILKGFDNPFASGRWAQGLIFKYLETAMGIFSLPFVNGLLGILFIALAAMLAVKALKISERLIAGFCGVIMAVFPTAASTFGYVFVVAAYFFALLLNVAAIYIMERRQSLLTLLLSAGLIAFACGLYQAYFSTAAVFAVSILIVDLFRVRDGEIKPIIVKAFWFLGALALGIAAYLVANRLILRALGMEMCNYQGMSSMGSIELSKLPAMIARAYSEFFDLCWYYINGHIFMRKLTALFLVLAAIVIVAELIRRKPSVKALVCFAAMLSIFPLAADLVYLMSSGEGFWVHVLMRYSLVFTFVMPAALIDKCSVLAAPPHTHTRARTLLCGALSALLAVVMLLIPSGYVYDNNLGYLNMDLLQRETEAYFTVLTTQIKSTEGYTDELPVAYIGEFQKEDKSFGTLPFVEDVDLAFFNFLPPSILNTYTWREFVAIHIGFSPEVVDGAQFKDSAEVAAMPCYPDQGSIRLVDGVIVVKFADVG